MKNLKLSKISRKLIIVFLLSFAILGIVGNGLIAQSDLSTTIEDQNNLEIAASADQFLQTYIDTLCTQPKSSLSSSDLGNMTMIENAFGVDAWSKSSYIAIAGEPPIVSEVFELASTGQNISESDYENLLEEHINNICEGKNFNREYLSYIGEDLLKLSPEETTQRNIILKEISENSPVRISTEAAMPYQYYLLHFDGQAISNDGLTENYRIALIYGNDGWQVYSLYCDSVSIPEGDK